jgi:long-subunit acyl-CoA synthetase (AMP-forming)
MPGMEACIMRDDGTDADADETGELWLRGGDVAMGYWNNEKASKETFIDGWVQTSSGWIPVKISGLYQSLLFSMSDCS